MTVDEAALCRDYEAGLSRRECARKYGVSDGTAGTILKRHGVAMRPPNGNGHASEVTRTEREARIRLVAGMVVGGTTDYHAIAEAVNKPPHSWNVTVATVKDYLTDARALLKDRTKEEIEDMRAIGRARYAALYQSAKTTRDKLEVLRDWHKFEGLYPATKQEITGKDGGEIILYIPDNGRRLRDAE